MSFVAKLESAATAVLALCAVIVTVVAVKHELFPSPSSALPKPVAITNWRDYATGREILGREKAPVTIIEFSDFQCPYCARLHSSIALILKRHPNEVGVIYRNFPLSALHPHARAAALAAECAADQNRFAEYHDYLFEHQDSIGRVTWSTVAARVGVTDSARFDNCLSSKTVSDAVETDSLAGEALNIRGTPTVLINQWKFPFAPNDSAIEETIRRELRSRSGS